MKTQQLCGLLFSALLLTLSSALAFDVQGPYNNSQSYVEYTLGANDALWLYALNAKDSPTQTILGLNYKLGTRSTSAMSPFSAFLFKNNDGTSPLNIGQYPNIIGRNNQPAPDQLGDFYRLVAANHFSGELANNYRDLGNGEWWRFMVDFGPLARCTELVVSRVNPTRQWMGFDYLNHDDGESRMRMTSDGWLTSTFLTTGMPAMPSAVYSLAIDDRDTPSRAVAVMTSDFGFGNDGNDPHFRNTECEGLWYTINGTSFTRVPIGNLWDPATTDMYNVQVAMIPASAGFPNGSYNVYVLGVNLTDPNSPEIFCKWATMTSGGAFTWHTSTAGQILEGDAIFPTYPMDLTVEWDAANSVFNLFAATTEKLYFAQHNGTDDNISWVPRMGTGSDVINTKNFRKIAIDPTNRATSLAVAGENASYRSTDRGLTWHLIRNSGRMVVFPATNAVQSIGSMVVLTARIPFTNETPNLFPVCAQTGPRQSSFEPTATSWDHVWQLGYTYNNNTVYLDASTADGRYYAAFSDASAQLSDGHTKGFVYSSSADGQTWYAGDWAGMAFPLNPDNIPVPSDVVAQPLESNRAYMSFENPGAGVPPFAATSDGGVSWVIPTNTDLPTTTGTRLLVAGSQAGVRRVYLAQGNQLWKTDDDGENWSQIAPLPFAGGIVDLACQDGRADYLTIISASQIASTSDGGTSWTPSYNAPTGTTLTGILTDPDQLAPRILWATYVDNVTNIPALAWSNNLGQSWLSIEKWNSADMSQYPSSTKLSLQRGTTPGNVRRIIWTATSWTGDVAALPSVESVKYFEFPILPITVSSNVTLSSPPACYYMVGTTTISQGATLTIPSGTTVYSFPACTLRVEGGLSAENSTFQEVSPTTPNGKWSGIYVNGSVSLSSCNIEGAVTGIETSKANTLSLSNCTISNCGNGLVAYQPSGTGAPQFDDCHFIGNEHDGISFLSVTNAGIDNCEISNNGGDGLVMTNSYAKITSSEFIDNGDSEGGYGLVCFGSSPFMACNNFESSQKGEVALYNQSYPLMDKNAGAGENSFFNADHNLIEMWDSYPLTTDGHNNFTVGSTGYFMADMSTSPPKRYISGNFWNPTLTLAALYPSSSNVYKWTSTDLTANSCGSSAGVGSNATQQMFASAMTAQTSGDFVASSALLSDLIEQYPDSVWAAPSVAQLFANQCMIGDGYDALQDELFDVSQANEESMLGAVAESYATRLYVEDEEFAPAVDTYTSNLADANSATDSMFAEVDLAITSFRADGGGGSLDQMNVADIHEVLRQMGALSGHAASSPMASHSGYVAIPKNVALENNFPNPFNAETTIRFYLPEATRAEVEVYNIIGQKVVTLADEYMTAGFHNVKWAAGDFASGVYLYQLKANGMVDTKKMVLIK